jgi:hypothetical protein
MASAPRLNKPKEKETQKAILEYLTYRGHYCWRNSTGAFSNEKKHFYRFGKKGSADIIGISREGKGIAVEVKSTGKKPTPEQIEFIREFRVRGGIGLVAYSVDDCIEAKL